jgi:ABC-type proline/glycine betaine transport system ATPase subunit
VGESGSGKTTTLKTINRLLEPDSGEVLIDWVPTRVHPAHLLRRRIGYVFQRIGLFPRTSRSPRTSASHCNCLAGRALSPRAWPNCSS